jgi:hypothetical protein
MREFALYIDKFDGVHVMVRTVNTKSEYPWSTYLSLAEGVGGEFVLEALREKEAKTNA